MEHERPTEDEPDGYRPRAHDHLVEPMFGGLGVTPELEGGDGATVREVRDERGTETGDAPGLWTRLKTFFSRAGGRDD